MVFDASAYDYYLAPGVTDMRKGIFGLVELIQTQMELDVFAKHLFAFCSRNKKDIKILAWDNGFWLMQRKICKGTFAWPKDGKEAASVSVEDFQRLLNGEDVFRKIPELKAHLTM